MLVCNEFLLYFASLCSFALTDYTVDPRNHFMIGNLWIGIILTLVSINVTILVGMIIWKFRKVILFEYKKCMLESRIKELIKEGKLKVKVPLTENQKLMLAYNKKQMRIKRKNERAVRRAVRAAIAAKNKSESIVMSARKENNVELSESFKQMLADFDDVYNNDRTYH